MSKGSGRRPAQVSQEQEADNWMQAFGDKWNLKDLEGNVISSHKSYELARDAGLKHFPIGEDFSVLKVR